MYSDPAQLCRNAKLEIRLILLYPDREIYPANRPRPIKLAQECINCRIPYAASGYPENNSNEAVFILHLLISMFRHHQDRQIESDQDQ